MKPYRATPIDKPIDSGEFVYGWYFEPYNAGWKSYIAVGHLEHNKTTYTLTEVHPSTVGQQVGLKDKNGKESYKSDKISFGSTRPIYLVKWSVCNAGFYLESMDEQKEHLVISNLVVGEIIGSLHTDPQNGEE